MMSITLLDIAASKSRAARQSKRNSSEAAVNAGDVTAVAAMLDYAMVEGTKMRLPLFVCLLRLALMALREESGTAGNGKAKRAS